MWSFLGSVVFFFLLLVASALWQRHTAKKPKPPSEEHRRLDEEIHATAEIAQRRHVRRYGKEDTGLHKILSGGGDRRK